MRSVESEVGPTHTKVGRQDSDSFFISDVKSEPGELANFEDPLEDPLLQADQSNDTKEFFAAGKVFSVLRDRYNNKKKIV